MEEETRGPEQFFICIIVWPKYVGCRPKILHARNFLFRA